MISGSSSAFILAMMRAFLPSRAFFASRRIALEDALVQRERRLQQVLQLERLAKAGQLHEHLA